MAGCCGAGGRLGPAGKLTPVILSELEFIEAAFGPLLLAIVESEVSGEVVMAAERRPGGRLAGTLSAAGHDVVAGAHRLRSRAGSATSAVGKLNGAARASAKVSADGGVRWHRPTTSSLRASAELSPAGATRQEHVGEFRGMTVRCVGPGGAVLWLPLGGSFSLLLVTGVSASSTPGPARLALSGAELDKAESAASGSLERLSKHCKEAEMRLPAAGGCCAVC